MASSHLFRLTMLEIRPADTAGVAVLLQWAKAEGWNPGVDDAEPFHAADPSGFLLGIQNEEIVSGISVVTSGPRFGFLGLYIVKPEDRGKGFGLQTWNAGLAYLGDRTIGLDGVVAQQANYARSGFSFAHRSIRFAGTAQTKITQRGDAQQITPADIADVVAFDGAFYGASRPRFLGRWLNGRGGRHAFMIKTGERISGYGVIRRCYEGYKIGPLFADDEDAANSLFHKMMRESGNETVFIDMPEPNTKGLRMMKHFGFTAVFETARMYRGLAPSLPLDAIYGLTSFELG
jgi:Acetyltransferase (GNAT) domain